MACGDSAVCTPSLVNPSKNNEFICWGFLVSYFCQFAVQLMVFRFKFQKYTDMDFQNIITRYFLLFHYLLCVSCTLNPKRNLKKLHSVSSWRVNLVCYCLENNIDFVNIQTQLLTINFKTSAKCRLQLESPFGDSQTKFQPAIPFVLHPTELKIFSLLWNH